MKPSAGEDDCGKGNSRELSAAQHKLKEEASLSGLLKIQPAGLSAEYWEVFTLRVWYSLDFYVTVITLLFLPSFFNLTPGWALFIVYGMTCTLKLSHMAFLLRAHSHNGKNSYSFHTRNAIVIVERVLRIIASYFVGRDWDMHNKVLSPAEISQAPWHKLAAYIAKRLIIYTGTTVTLWQAFCMPTVWALESLLLLPLLLMSLYARAPPTAAFLAEHAPGSGVFHVRTALAAACSAACRAALPVDHETSSICELGVGAQAGTADAVARLQQEQHLVATLMIFMQYLAPLYLRYQQEHSVKREFIWPHLSSKQRATFLCFHLPRSRWRRAALSLLLHALALTYLLAVAVVLGRAAARHLMPRSHTELSHWWLRQ